MQTDSWHRPPQPVDPLDRSRFPIDPWRLVERAYEKHDLGVTETLFSVSNGYLGLRGNVEEGRDTHTHGSYVNGFHETWTIQHAEEAYGLARVGQTIVNVPDPKTIKLYVDDEPLLLSVADLESYERTLDMRAGLLSRDLIWRTSSGKRVRISSTRMTSLVERHLAVMTFEVEMLDGDASLVISSSILNRQDGSDEYNVSSAAMGEGLDPRQAESFEHRVLQPRRHEIVDDRLLLGYRCTNSKMTIATLAHHAIETDNAWTQRRSVEEDLAKQVYEIAAESGRPVRVEQLVAVHTSSGVPPRELADRCGRTLDRALSAGVRRLQREHAELWERFWAESDVAIEGQPAVQQAVRWNLFQRAGHHPGRQPRHTRQGPDRDRLRRPLLLGHRVLRRPVPHLHPPAGGAQRAALPSRDARRRPPPRGRALAVRGALPVADDQWRRGLRLLPGRHGAVPPQRRHRLRPDQVRARDRRPPVPPPPGRRHPRGDGSAVGRCGFLAAQRRPVVPHPRRHRAR